jgi:hypothetical protein
VPPPPISDSPALAEPAQVSLLVVRPLATTCGAKRSVMSAGELKVVVWALPWFWICFELCEELEVEDVLETAELSLALVDEDGVLTVTTGLLTELLMPTPTAPDWLAEEEDAWAPLAIAATATVANRSFMGSNPF